MDIEARFGTKLALETSNELERLEARDADRRYGRWIVDLIAAVADDQPVPAQRRGARFRHTA